MECPWTEIFSNLHNSGKELCLVQNKTYPTCNTPLHHCVMNTCYGPILWQHCLKKRRMHFFNYMLLHHVVIIFVAYLFYSYSKSLIGDFFLSDFYNNKNMLRTAIVIVNMVGNWIIDGIIFDWLGSFLDIFKSVGNWRTSDVHQIFKIIGKFHLYDSLHPSLPWTVSSFMRAYTFTSVYSFSAIDA